MIMTFRSNLEKKGIKTMKIFYKKDFQRVLEEKSKIEEEYQIYKEKSEKAITELNIKNSSQLKEITDLGNQIIDKNSAIKRYTILQTEISEENSKLKSKLTHANTSKGGLVKENNKLKKEKEQFITEISKLEEQVKDLKSDRYVRKPIRADRTKSTIKTKIASPMKSSVIRFMKQEHGE